MCLVMVSGAGFPATDGVEVATSCNAGAASGSSVHAESAATVAAASRAVAATRSEGFREPSDAKKAGSNSCGLPRILCLRKWTVVELRGFEPLTSSMPLTRSPN